MTRAFVAVALALVSCAHAPQADDNAYFAYLHTTIHRSCRPTQEFRGKLKATISIHIDANGALSNAQLDDSSGNDAFDAVALDAVRRAAPFTPPPDQLRKSLKNPGVALVFTP